MAWHRVPGKHRRVPVPGEGWRVCLRPTLLPPPCCAWLRWLTSLLSPHATVSPSHASWGRDKGAEKGVIASGSGHKGPQEVMVQSWDGGPALLKGLPWWALVISRGEGAQRSWMLPRDTQLSGGSPPSSAPPNAWCSDSKQGGKKKNPPGHWGTSSGSIFTHIWCGKVKVWVALSCLILCNPMEPARLLCPWNSPDKNTGVGSHSLLQGIFLTQGLNTGLLHCRQILYHLSHQGSPRRLDSTPSGNWEPLQPPSHLETIPQTPLGPEHLLSACFLGQ